MSTQPPDTVKQPPGYLYPYVVHSRPQGCVLVEGNAGGLPRVLLAEPQPLTLREAIRAALRTQVTGAKP